MAVVFLIVWFEEGFGEAFLKASAVIFVAVLTALIAKTHPFSIAKNSKRHLPELLGLSYCIIFVATIFLNFKVNDSHYMLFATPVVIGIVWRSYDYFRSRCA